MREVVLARRAESELEQGHAWWAKHRSLDQANRWYDGFVAQMVSLEQNPERCELAPENGSFAHEIRQLSFGLGRRPTHRAVFTIRPTEVVILRVRHLAQGPIAPDAE